MTGSLFTSEVMQSAAQEMTQEEEQEITKSADPAGDQVCVMPVILYHAELTLIHLLSGGVCV